MRGTIHKPSPKVKNQHTHLCYVNSNYIYSYFYQELFLQLILKKHQRDTKGCTSTEIAHYHRICTFSGRFRGEGRSTSGYTIKFFSRPPFPNPPATHPDPDIAGEHHHNGALVQKGHTTGKKFSLLNVMGGQNNSGVLQLDLFDQRPYLATYAGIQPHRGFIQKKNGRWKAASLISL